MTQKLLFWAVAGAAILASLALWAEMGLAVALGDASWFCVS